MNLGSTALAPASRRPLRVIALAAPTLLLGGAAAAQTITTGQALSVVDIPVDHPAALALFALALAAFATWHLLAGRGLNGTPFLWTGIVLLTLWATPSLRAQVLSQFTDPAGETLPIPVVLIEERGVVIGFERADFENAAGAPLSIVGIEEPDFSHCFPLGLDSPLPPPAPLTDDLCEVGLLLPPGDGCSVDVDTLCKAAAAPFAVIAVAPADLTFEVGSTGTLVVSNHTDSPVTADDLAATFPGGSVLSVDSTTCSAALAPGASCDITLAAATQEGPTEVTVTGSNTNTVTVDVTVDPASAVIEIAPGDLVFAENSTGTLVVTNQPASPVAATDVVATIPAGSNISVQSTTCTATLAIGASCGITLAAATQEGPTSVTVAGSNTNAVPVDVTVVPQPQIAITGPVLQGRVITVGGPTPLGLVITNDAGSAVNANAVTVSDQSAVPDLTVDDSDCTSIAPGDSCTLELSSNTPYAPATITVGGSNTANAPTTRIAFSHLGGLVYEESGGSGKVIADAGMELTSQWTSTLSSVAGATSLTDGVANTNAIVVAASCSGDTSNCAAQRCRNVGADWYLPALHELANAVTTLCPAATIPCDFGGFPSAFHWNSTHLDSSSAWLVGSPFGSHHVGIKTGLHPVRCTRQFGP